MDENMERVKRIVHAKTVYEKGYTGKGIRIALLDTGVSSHIGLQEKTVLFRDYIKYKRRSYDDNGHGTHIAGILCGDMGPSAGRNQKFYQCGMAPGAELAVFKILDYNGTGSTDKALRALDWLIANHKKENIRLLNFSMGYLPNANPKIQKQLVEKLELLWDAGVTVVTAAGNNGPEENSITVPGVSRKVITVGSSDDIPVAGYTVSKAANTGYGGRGPTDCCIVKPEILAPGSDVYSFSNNGTGFQKKSGTSMSVPVVCGALALALEKNPNLKPVELKLLLYDSVSAISDRNVSAWGILHVDNLMKML